ncbi:embryonic protein UVS.2-like [Ascaphus truei]|uniref:embryonic protein UVS.2-like n=1 Tax=Ascaphus truei TaxID=8439 RepID=UPI003F5A6BAA
MEVTMSLTLLASLIHCSMGLPLQIFFENLAKKVCLNTISPCTYLRNCQSLFSIIAESNKDRTMMMYEGDIALNAGRSAMKCDGGACRWNKNSNGIVNVPYNLSSEYNADEVSVITTAMQDFATLTCVCFVPRTMESDYLQIKSDFGCWSFLGKTGGPQEVSVQKDSCVVKGSVQHELNHALGFYHEQSRSDRDKYIDIITDNIIAGTLGNFEAHDTSNLGLEYDYSSVMHYGRFAFAKIPGEETIVPKPDSSVTIGQRYGLSNLDISKINRLYQCRACSTLLPESTGTLMSANNPNNYPNNASCVWLIRAPSDQIFLQFSAFDVQASTGCVSDYLKVYDGATRMSPVLLDRACGMGQLPSLVASGNMMLVEFVTDVDIAATGFKASYSTVKCGSTFTNSTGILSSPNYPSPYPSSVDCSWVITAPLGFKVSLTMIDFYVEKQRICKYDYLLIFNGPKPTYPQLGPYCNPAIVPNIVSTGSSLLLQFHSDGSVQTRGFQAKYGFGTQGHCDLQWMQLRHEHGVLPTSAEKLHHPEKSRTRRIRLQILSTDPLSISQNLSPAKSCNCKKSNTSQCRGRPTPVLKRHQQKFKPSTRSAGPALHPGAVRAASSPRGGSCCQRIGFLDSPGKREDLLQTSLAHDEWKRGTCAVLLRSRTSLTYSSQTGKGCSDISKEFTSNEVTACAALVQTLRLCGVETNFSVDLNSPSLPSA